MSPCCLHRGANRGRGTARSTSHSPAACRQSPSGLYRAPSTYTPPLHGTVRHLPNLQVVWHGILRGNDSGRQNERCQQCRRTKSFQFDPHHFLQGTLLAAIIPASFLYSVSVSLWLPSPLY